jgi:hypothetical protein
MKGLGRNYRFGGTSGLLFGDLFDCALDLWDINLLVVHFNDLAEDSPHLEELVFVAGDEVELGESHFGCVDRDGFRCWYESVLDAKLKIKSLPHCATADRIYRPQVLGFIPVQHEKHS